MAGLENFLQIKVTSLDGTSAHVKIKQLVGQSDSNLLPEDYRVVEGSLGQTEIPTASSQNGSCEFVKSESESCLDKRSSEVVIGWAGWARAQPIIGDQRGF